MSDLHDVREEYENPPLTRADLDADPIAQFGAWFEQALALGGLANAMTLATATADGRPSTRTVLLKEFGPEGFVFFTDYGSRKAAELAGNPRVSLLFYWEPMHRQVRIQGSVSKVDEAESISYFDSRPLGSRLAASISRQSHEVADRSVLEAAMKEARETVGEAVQRPDRWGGYLVRPTEFEFWQGRPNRLHDRFEYRPDGDGWRIVRLMP